MSAPSSVETSTSTGSGDWLNREGVGACWPASSSLLASILPSVPTQTTHQPSLSLSDTSWGDESWGDRLTGDEQYGITRAQKLMRREGEPPLFFFFFFFVLFDSLFVFFFQNKTEPLCLIAPDTDCVRMKVSLCTWVGVCLLSSLVPFLNFFDNWEGGGSAKQQRQFYVIISSSSPSS